MNSKVGILAINQFANYCTISCALSKVGVDYQFVSEPSELDKVDGIIIPGVGSFSSLSGKLMRDAWYNSMHAFVSQGKGILGICLGMQILFDSGDETIKEYSSKQKGLSFLKGVVSPIHGSKNPEYGFKDI